MVSKFTQPDITSQDENTWLGAVDDAVAVHHRLAGMFAPHAQDTPDLTVRIDAGHILNPISQTLSEVAAQNTGALSAPIGDPRYDIVYVDRLTGAAGVAAGSEAASPADPAIPAGKTPVARIAWTVGMTEITDADLTDIRDLTALGFSFDGTSGTILLTDGDGSGLSGLTVGDPTARDMAILNAFDIAELLGSTALSLGSAVVDAFEDQTGIDAGASSGQLYDSVQGAFGTSVSTTETDMRSHTNTSYDAREYVDLFQALSNDVTVEAISVYSTTAFSGQVAVYRSNGSNNYTVMHEESVSHGGAGWQTFTLASPYAVPASGTYYVGCYKPTGSVDVVTGGGASYLGSAAASSSFTRDSDDCVPCGFKETVTSSTMTLISVSLTAASTPSTARVVLDHEDLGSSATINTDVTLEISRDGGTTFTAAVLTELRDAGSGRKAYVADVDLTGQPTGTSVKLRGKQLNGTAGRWHRWAAQTDVALAA